MKKALLLAIISLSIMTGCEYVDSVMELGDIFKEATTTSKTENKNQDDDNDYPAPAASSGKTITVSTGKAGTNTGKEYPPYGVIYTIDNCDDAKRLAYTENRPVLVIVGEKTCSMCRALSERAVETDEFRKYLADRRIVCVKMWNSVYGVIVRTKFRKEYKPMPDINGEPWLFMAKVVSDELLGAKPENLYPDQIDLVKSSATGAWFCGSYGHGFHTITGLDTAKNYTEWTPTRLMKELDAAFKEDDWD